MVNIINTYELATNETRTSTAMCLDTVHLEQETHMQFASWARYQINNCFIVIYDFHDRLGQLRRNYGMMKLTDGDALNLTLYWTMCL